ncbi:acyl carrier protein [Streptomyces longwoodensis]|uniref:Acyl carrier protein n=1 Tax=Streptomyces novoguineensis TaxID=2586640 RepID=A0A4Y5QS69_9ACTN|nr:AmcB [Streptomyces novoguineensis]QHW08544.1 acyl carrier protein [Streptomyces novoguineensis]BBE52696.1 acyl carrier protein [Streptomyces sp.]
MNQTEAAIRSIIVNDLFCEIPESEIGVDDGLRDVLALDSLGFLELRVTCEQQFGVEISEDDFTPEHFATIRSVAALVHSLRRSRLETA